MDENEEYIDIFEGLQNHGCICLLHANENGGLAKLQICTRDETVARELGSMLRCPMVSEDDEILKFKDTVEIQVVFDKPQE